MFREFIYLDMDWIQSIIAQIQEGLLKDVIEGKVKEVSAKVGFIARLFEVQGKYAIDAKQSKILHDYSFNVALESLDQEELLIPVDGFEREEFPVPESYFILTKGTPKIVDYSAMLRLIENQWKTLNPIRSASKKKGKREEEIDPSQVKALLDTFYGDVIQINITNTSKVRFTGLLSRKHLREDIRSLIFRYGSELKGEWLMLAQVSKITIYKEVSSTMFEEMEDKVSQSLDKLSLENLQRGSDYFSELLQALNIMQEYMASVSYPDISVLPIAIYREIKNFR